MASACPTNECIAGNHHTSGEAFKFFTFRGTQTPAAPTPKTAKWTRFHRQQLPRGLHYRSADGHGHLP